MGDVVKAVAPAIGFMFGGPMGSALVGAAMGAGVGSGRIGGSGWAGRSMAGGVGGYLGGMTGNPAWANAGAQAGVAAGNGGTGWLSRGAASGAAGYLSGSAAQGVANIGKGAYAGWASSPSDASFMTKASSAVGGGMGAAAQGAGTSTAGSEVAKKYAPAVQTGLNVAGQLDYQQQMQKAAESADPFAGERGAYQSQLRQLMDDPSTITQTEAYKFRYSQGLEAIKRNAARGGYSSSGNIDTALAEYGQGLASQMYNEEVTRLSKLAGVDSGSPADASSAYSKMAEGRQSMYTDLGQLYKYYYE
jgi:hypothetical protein